MSDSAKLPADPRVIVTSFMVGICHMQVCAVNDATDEEMLAAANRENPSGTSMGWSDVVRDDGHGAPVPCGDNPATRTHFLLEC